MKYRATKLSKIVGITSFAISAFLISSCSKLGVGGQSYTVDGIGNGAQVVPLSSSSAISSISGTFDGSANTLVATIKWSNLSGAPTSIHIHAGGVGRNGYAFFVLQNIPKSVTDSINFRSAFTESEESGVKPGTYYYDIHTAAFPNGEIRGQIIAH